MKMLFNLTLLFFSNVLFAQNAKDIIDSSKNAYVNLEMYQDSGKVLQEFYNLPNNQNPYENAKYFKTDYNKNGQFNFEYYEAGRSNSLYVINRGLDNKVQSWWGVTNALTTDRSLKDCLSAARGVSSLTSTQIPELLFSLNYSILGVNIFESLTNEKLIGLEEISGQKCYRIDGNKIKEGTISIWISKDDFLIRKIEIDQKVSNFRVKSTYQYFAKIPTSIATSVFEFRPNRKVKL